MITHKKGGRSPLIDLLLDHLEYFDDPLPAPWGFADEARLFLLRVCEFVSSDHDPVVGHVYQECFAAVGRLSIPQPPCQCALVLEQSSSPKLVTLLPQHMTQLPVVGSHDRVASRFLSDTQADFVRGQSGDC